MGSDAQRHIICGSGPHSGLSFRDVLGNQKNERLSDWGVAPLAELTFMLTKPADPVS